MIWIISGLVVAGLAWWLIYLIRKWGDGNDREGQWICAIMAAVFLGLSAILTPPLAAMSNGRGLEQWKAFYDANSRNYAIAVDETASYLSAEKYVEQALVPVEGSIEKWKLADDVSARILEWRDAVNEYNSTIASMKYFNCNIFFGVLVPNEVEDMKLLVIE